MPSRIAIGARHACVVLPNDAIRCWGEGLNGELGYGNTESVGAYGTSPPVNDVPVL